MTPGDVPTATEFLALLIAVAVVAVAVRFIRIPYTIALVLAGLALALAPGAPHIEVTPGVILIVFLPILLFHAAYNLDLTDLRANLGPIAVLAFPGVAVTAAVVGAALHAVTALPWSQCLLFGAIVAATDPVAVLAIFGELGAPRRLAAIVAGESLFNDGTALVLVTAALGAATTSTISAGATIEQFVVEVIGGLALGVAVGSVGSTVLRSINDALLETTITLIMAYGGYLLATVLHCSGPLETVAAGLFLGRRGVAVMSSATRLQAHATWEFLDFLANSLLFLLVGLAVRPIGESAIQHLGHGVWGPLAVAIVAIIVARAAVVWGVGLVMAQRDRAFELGWRPMLLWAGLRGGVSLAAALGLPTSLASRELLLALTFGVVLFTLLAQGLTVGPLLRRLHLEDEGDTRRDFAVTLARLRTIETAIQEIDLLHRANAVGDGVAERLRDHYEGQREALLRRVEATTRRSEHEERQQEAEAVHHLLHVQHEAAHAAYRRGQISSRTLRALIAQIDHDLAHTLTAETGAFPMDSLPGEGVSLD